MTQLRSLIKTTQDLTVLRQSIRNSLTPQKLIGYLTDKTITDPALVTALTQAAGKKIDKPLKTRLSDAIAATMLGFNNAHELFAYYDAVCIFHKSLWTWEHRYGTDHLEFYADPQITLGNFDLGALTSTDLELNLTDETLNCIDTSEDALTREDIGKEHKLLTADTFGAAWVAFSQRDRDELPRITDKKECDNTLALLADLAQELDGAQNFAHINTECLDELDGRLRYQANRLSEYDTLASYWRHAATTLSESIQVSFELSRIQSGSGQLRSVDGQHTLIWSQSHQVMAIALTESGELLNCWMTALSAHDSRAAFFNK